MKAVFRAVLVWAIISISILSFTSMPLCAADDLAPLWQNKFSEAAAAYRARVQKNPQDATAWLGLALVHDNQDAVQAATQDWANYMRLAPGSWQTQAYWPRLVDDATQTRAWGQLDSVAQKLVATKSVAPSLRAAAQLVLAKSALRAGKTANATAIWTQLGYLRKWMVIGPFDNVSDCGIAKAYPPEEEINFTKTYPGQNDLSLQWHTLLLVSPDGNCKVGAALGDSEQSVFYAATAVKVATAQPALLQFDPTSASKLFVNGQQVFSDDLYRQQQNLVADPFCVRVSLQAGYNRILVKLASSAEEELEGTCFRLRLTTTTGATLPLTAINPQQAQTKQPVTALAPAPTTPPATVTITALRALPQTAETALALGYNLRLAKDYQAASDQLRIAIARTPEVALLHWELSRTLTADDQMDEARAARDQTRKLAHGIVEAELDYLSEKQESFAATEYINRLKALQAQFPNSPKVCWALYGAYSGAEMKSEDLKAARKAAALAPGEDNTNQLASSYYYTDKKTDAMQVLTSACGADAIATRLLRYQAVMLDAQGKKAQAIMLYQRLLALDPSQVEYRQSLIDCHEESKSYQQALKVLDILLQQCPQDAQVYVRYGDILSEMRRGKEAAAMYSRALRLDPSHVELREKIRAVTGEPSILALAPATPAEKILANAAKQPAPEGASIMVFLDEARQIVYPDFATETHYHAIMKVLDDSTAKALQNFPMEFVTATSEDTVKQARLIKKDGKIQDVTAECDGEITFPSLEAGDIIEVSYHVQDYHPGGLAKQFWSEWRFTREGTCSALSRYVLITPAAMKYTTANHGQVPQPAVKEVKGWRVSEWRIANGPVQPEDHLSAGANDRDSWLDISTVASWRDIVRWYRDLSGPLCIPDAAIRAKAAELTKNAGSETEKLRAISAFVAREIEYQSTPFRMSAYIPTKGKKVLREQFGDCKDKAILLTALLAAVNIKSDVVLLNGRSDGLTPYLPSPRFSHVIARVSTEKGPLWIDATADQMEFGAFPTEDAGVPCLVISDESSELVTSPVPSVENNQDLSDFRMTLKEDGSVSCNVTVTVKGSYNWMLRMVIKQVPAAQHNYMLQLMAERLFKTAKFDSGAIGNLEDRDVPLSLSFQVHSDNFATPAGDFLLMRLPWTNEITRLNTMIDAPHRTTDAEVATSYGKSAITVQLELPAGYAPEGLQPETGATTPWGSYKITYSQKNNLLIAKFEYYQTALRVSAADAEKYVQFISGIAKETEKQLVLRKVATPAKP
jgi:cellulose synthase operon protein C